MKIFPIASVAVTLALAGCSTASLTGYGGGSTPTGASGGSVSVNLQGGSAAGMLLGIATVAALIGARRDPSVPHAEPEMLEGRAISEVDCAQPIADWTKNLRCR